LLLAAHLVVLHTALAAALVAIEQTHLSQLPLEQAIPLPLVVAAQREHPAPLKGPMAQIPFLVPLHLLAVAVAGQSIITDQMEAQAAVGVAGLALLLELADQEIHLPHHQAKVIMGALDLLVVGIVVLVVVVALGLLELLVIQRQVEQEVMDRPTQ
jgi:hypothetical protein